MRRPRLRSTRSTRSTSLITRVQLASIVLAVLVAGSFGGLVLAITNLRASNQRVTRSKDVTRSTLVLEKLVVDLETGLRGFVLTGNEKFLDPWRKARRSMPYAIRHLQALVPKDDRAQQKREVNDLIAPRYIGQRLGSRRWDLIKDSDRIGIRMHVEKVRARGI